MNKIISKTLFSGVMALVLLPCAAKADEATAAVNLDNLVPYTQPAAAWSDRYSNVTVTWGDPAVCGPQRFASLVGSGGTEICPRLLSWRLAEEGKSLPLAVKSRNFRPDKIVEMDSADALELTAIVSCPMRNGLAVEFTLVNQAARPRTIQIGFDYPGKGVRPDWSGPCPVGKCFRLENEPEGSWSTLYVHNEHGRNILWVSNFVAGMTQGTTLEMVCLADLSRARCGSIPTARRRWRSPWASAAIAAWR